MLNDENKIIIYSLEGGAVSNEIKPTYKIISIFPNPTMTKAIVIDSEGIGYLLNFLTERSIKINDFSSSITKILWDSTNHNLFSGYSKDSALTFIYTRNHYKGEKCETVKEILSMDEVNTSDKAYDTMITREHIPMILTDGYLVTLSPENSVVSLWLSSHTSFAYFTANPDDEMENLRYFF